MTRPTAVNIFDGHNDLAYQLWQRGDRKGTGFLNENEAALSITAQKAAAGGLQAGLFALFVPQPRQALDTSSAAQQAYAFETACQNSYLFCPCGLTKRCKVSTPIFRVEPAPVKPVQHIFFWRIKIAVHGQIMQCAK